MFKAPGGWLRFGRVAVVVLPRSLMGWSAFSLLGETALCTWKNRTFFKEC